MKNHLPKKAFFIAPMLLGIYIMIQSIGCFQSSPDQRLWPYIGFFLIGLLILALSTIELVTRRN